MTPLADDLGGGGAFQTGDYMIRSEIGRRGKGSTTGQYNLMSGHINCEAIVRSGDRIRKSPNIWWY
jgi:hypothetical protein